MEVFNRLVNNINRSAAEYVGLFGYAYGATISNVGLVNVSITGKNQVGGLAGYSQGNITNSYTTGSVSGTHDVGGLVGYNYDLITDSYSTVTVTGSEDIGGLVGHNEWGLISDSYANGSVSGVKWVGGLAGYNYNEIFDSYATGKVSGEKHIGGLVGYNAGTVAGSFWDTVTSRQSTSAGGEGKTTEEMMDLATFSSWDIDDAGGTGKTWRIYDGYTYPLLRSFLIKAPANVNADAKVYDGTTALTGTSYRWKTAVDTDKIFGTASYEAESDDAGKRNIILTGLYSNQQGYDIDYRGRVDISKAPLVVTAEDDVKLYHDNAYYGGNGVTYNGLVSGEDSTVLEDTLDYGGDSQGALLVGTYDITPFGLMSDNYYITYISGVLTINNTHSAICQTQMVGGNNENLLMMGFGAGGSGPANTFSPPPILDTGNAGPSGGGDEDRISNPGFPLGQTDFKLLDYFLQNSGMSRIITVYISSLPASMQNERTHFPRQGIAP